MEDILRGATAFITGSLVGYISQNVNNIWRNKKGLLADVPLDDKDKNLLLDGVSVAVTLSGLELGSLFIYKGFPWVRQSPDLFVMFFIGILSGLGPNRFSHIDDIISRIFRKETPVEIEKIK
jgi:hypothetical protein